MADRFTHPDDYTGDRCKGKRIGTLWYSENQDSGDVTVSEYYDSLDSIQKLDLLGDIIGMLNREYKVAQDEFHAEYAKYGEKNGSADT
jgi:hypothetical protein